MRERRVLKFAYHRDQPDGLGDIARVGIHETNRLISVDLLSHLRRQLQIKSKRNASIFREFVLVRCWCRQSELQCQRMQDVPRNSIIFTIRISVTNY